MVVLRVHVILELGLDTRPRHHLENRVADLQVVAVVQLGITDTLVVHERSVGRATVFDVNMTTTRESLACLREIPSASIRISAFRERPRIISGCSSG